MLTFRKGIIKRADGMSPSSMSRFCDPSERQVNKFISSHAVYMAQVATGLFKLQADKSNKIPVKFDFAQACTVAAAKAASVAFCNQSLHVDSNDSTALIFLPLVDNKLLAAAKAVERTPGLTETRLNYYRTLFMTTIANKELFTGDVINQNFYINPYELGSESTQDETLSLLALNGHNVFCFSFDPFLSTVDDDHSNIPLGVPVAAESDTSTWLSPYAHGGETSIANGQLTIWNRARCNKVTVVPLDFTRVLKSIMSPTLNGDGPITDVKKAYSTIYAMAKNSTTLYHTDFGKIIHDQYFTKKFTPSEDDVDTLNFAETHMRYSDVIRGEVPGQQTMPIQAINHRILEVRSAILRRETAHFEGAGDINLSMLLPNVDSAFELDPANPYTFVYGQWGSSLKI